VLVKKRWENSGGEVKMQIKWKILLGKIIIWLAAEICLNFLGLDSLADYSEFIFQKDVIVFLD
jgi:hypothetical protein